jgi:predicted SprT family Zn-dependent metalloprotease
MPERHNPNDPHFLVRHAVASYQVVTSIRLHWSCTCGTQNETNLDRDKLNRQLPWKIEARCGRCHGSLITLVDRRGYNYLPSRLSQHLNA